MKKTTGKRIFEGYLIRQKNRSWGRQTKWNTEKSQCRPCQTSPWKGKKFLEILSFCRREKHYYIISITVICCTSSAYIHVWFISFFYLGLLFFIQGLTVFLQKVNDLLGSIRNIQLADLHDVTLNQHSQSRCRIPGPSMTEDLSHSREPWFYCSWENTFEVGIPSGWKKIIYHRKEIAFLAFSIK